MLKEFMLANLIPQLQKDGNGRSHYIQDTLRAAVIMLYVWTQYQFKLDNAELHRLCTALCLPKSDKGDFLKDWTKFSQDVTPLKK